RSAARGFTGLDVNVLDVFLRVCGDCATTKLAKAIKIPNGTSLFITISPVKGLAGYTPPAHNCQDKWIIWKKRGASLMSKLSSCSGCASGWATISRARSD